jgi:purine catabolism regulator
VYLHRGGGSYVTERAQNRLTVQGLIEAFEPRIVAAGGTGGLSKVIEGVSVETEDDPVRWMAPHSLLLTAGTMVRADPDRGQRLIEQLVDAEMVGVGLAMAPYWTDVPQAMIAAADRLSFPLLRISGGICFHEIVTHVFAALSAKHTYMLQRTVSVQGVLAGLLAKDRRPQAITDCLSDHLDVDVLFFNWRGRLLARSRSGAATLGNAASAENLWRLYLSSPQSPSGRLFGGREAHFREVRIEGGLEGLLAAVLPDGRSLNLFIDRTLSFARTLLEAEALAGRSFQAGMSQARGALLVELLSGGGNEAELSERLAHYGITGTELWRLILLTTEGQTRDRGGTKATRLLADEGVGLVNVYLESLSAHFLAAWHRGRLAILVGLRLGDEELDPRAFAQGLVQQTSRELRLEGLRAGVSEPFSGAAGGMQALVQASQAMFYAANKQREQQWVVLYEDLGLHVAALGTLPDEYLERFHARIIQPLLEADRTGGCRLYETLLTYLEHDRSLAHTAQALYLHRNTLARRLEHVEKIIGVDLHTTDGLVEVHLATQATEVLRVRRRQ